MEKSFYYKVSLSQMTHLKQKLSDQQIPFSIEQLDKEVAFVFPDLPIRQYHQVYQLFGSVGKRYST